MEKKQTDIRKTVVLDKELVQQCERLYGMAGVKNFSQFVKQALNQYTEILVLGNYQDLLSKQVKKEIAAQLKPINSRLSKALYRYAVELDMMCQLIGYGFTDYGEREFEYIRRAANVRVAKNRGYIDVPTLLQEEIEEDESYEPETY